MRKATLGLTVIALLTACAMQPPSEYWDALINEKTEYANARSLLDAHRYEQALISIDRAATLTEARGGDSGKQNTLRLEALTSMGNVDAATSAYAVAGVPDSHFLKLFETALMSSRSHSPNQAVAAAQQLLFRPTQTEVEAQFKESLPDDFTSVSGGGDFTVHFPSEWFDSEHPNLTETIVLVIAILRQNPGSEAAMEFLLNTPSPMGSSVKLRGLNTVQEQIAIGAFSGEGLVLARAFVEDRHEDIEFYKRAHKQYCDNYARYRPCKERLNYWWYPNE